MFRFKNEYNFIFSFLSLPYNLDSNATSFKMNTYF